MNTNECTHKHTTTHVSCCVRLTRNRHVCPARVSHCNARKTTAAPKLDHAFALQHSKLSRTSCANYICPARCLCAAARGVTLRRRPNSFSL